MENEMMNREENLPVDGQETGLPQAEGLPAETEGDAGAVPLADPESRALLDALTDDAGQEKAEALPETAVPAGAGTQAAPEAGKGEAASGGAGAARPEGAKDEDVLGEIKSERGRARVREIIEEKKAIEAQVGELHQAFTTAGMSTEDFARTLEFSRLATSQDLHENRLALEMLDNVRAGLCRRLGVSGRGFDILDDFPDLKKRVDELDMDRSDAEGVARSRLMERERLEQAQVQRQAQVQHREYTNQVRQFQTNAGAYFRTRETEVDYPAKIAKIQRYFSEPGKLQHFISTFEPHQWLPQLQIMYDSMTVSRPVSPTPIRSRPQNLGRQNMTNATPEDIIGNAMDQLGL